MFLLSTDVFYIFQGIYIYIYIYVNKFFNLGRFPCFLTVKFMIYFCLDESVKTRLIVAGKFPQLVEQIIHSIQWHNLGRRFRDMYDCKLTKSP